MNRAVPIVIAMVVAVSGCADKPKASGPSSTPPPTSATGTSPSNTPPPPPTWHLGVPPQSKPTSVYWDVAATDATHAWAVGHEAYSPTQSTTSGVSIVEAWNGKQWSRMPTPDLNWHGSFRLVAADSPTDVWVVGSAVGNGPEDTVTRVLRYDGSQWHEIPFPPGNAPSLMSITDLAVVGGHAWLVGHKGTPSVILEWDGQGWQDRPSPAECRQAGTSFGGMPTFCNVTGITAFAPNDIWAAGNGAWQGFKGPLTFHWNGVSWQAIQVGIYNEETALTAIAGKSPTDIWAVGNGNPGTGPIAVHGDGKSWQVLRDLPAAKLDGLAVDADGNPWVIENFPAPSASLATYGTGKSWAVTAIPNPPNTIGVSLQGIAAVPGTPMMLAVGDADLPGDPRLLQAVILEYSSG